MYVGGKEETAVAKDEKRRQKSVQRRTAKRKLRRLQVGVETEHVSSRAAFRAAAAWPFHECLISQDWQSGEHLVQIVVARKSPAGSVAAGVFLVDLGCLGVKSAFPTLLYSFAEYDERLRRQLMATQPLMNADLNLAARIIREAIAYARWLGFDPDPDYWAASAVLTGADPDACDVPVPLGKDGKPFYIAGPRDNARKIVVQLNRAVGEGNFHFIVPVGPAW